MIRVSRGREITRAGLRELFVHVSVVADTRGQAKSGRTLTMVNPVCKGKKSFITI